MKYSGQHFGQRVSSLLNFQRQLKRALQAGLSSGTRSLDTQLSARIIFLFLNISAGGLPLDFEMLSAKEIFALMWNA